MLDFIRTRSGGIVSIIIVGAIALVFVFWGVGGQNTGDAINIHIDGESYPIVNFLQTRKSIQDNMRSEAQSLDPNVAELLATQRALSTLVQRHVLNVLAKDTGRIVPPEAIAAAIKADPSFQENGRFSKALYEKTVTNSYGMNLPVFEASVRSQILLNDTGSFVQDLSFLPTEALREQYHLSLDQISLNYVFFPASAQEEGLSPSDAELEEFFKGRAENYRRPAEVKVEYVSFNPDDFLSDVKIDNDALEELYLEQAASLSSPPVADTSSILIAFPNFTPTPSEKEAALEKARAIFQRAQTEDFATLATEVSDDAQTAQDGGKLPPVSPGQNLPELDRLIFGGTAPKAGDILGPVETIFGYQIIKIDAYTPLRIQTLSEARPALTETLKKRDARRAAVNRLEDLLDASQAQASSDLKSLASTLGLTSVSSDFFSPENPPAFLGGSSAEAEKAAAQPLGLISEPVDTPTVLSLYVPLERKESYIPDFDDPELKEALKTDWLAAESLKKAEEAAIKLIEAQKEEGFVKAAKAISEGSPEMGSTPLAARREILSAQEPISLSDLGLLIKTVFSLARTGDTSKVPIPTDAGNRPGYLVISLRDFKAADDKDFENALSEWRSNFGQAAASESFVLWVTSRTGQVQLRIPPELQAEFKRLSEGQSL
jgi:peptidyl-prolyl cis-trans isomerase D